MHSDVHRKNLFDRPLGHLCSDEHRASGDLMSSRALNERAHYTLRDRVRGIDAAMHDVSRLSLRQFRGGVIRLLRPSLIDELNAPSLHDDIAFVR